MSKRQSEALILADMTSYRMHCGFDEICKMHVLIDTGTDDPCLNQVCCTG